MKRVVFLLGLALILFLPTFEGMAQGPAQPGSPVIQLIAMREGRGGRLVPRWAGSGVIVSADGLILTSCHVALPRAIWEAREFDYDLLVVALTVRRNAAPRPLYLAEVIQCNAALDLAVVQVSAMLDGRALPANLDLPVQPLGRPEHLRVGDSLQVVGYPGGAGETVAVVEATVVRLPRDRQPGWIELDTEVEGGFSGGPVLNAAGELVGVVAVGSAENAGDVAHCRYTGDTGGDGILDLDDACTTTGGAIVTARPVNLAEALLWAAGYGAAPEPTATPRPRRQQPTATPRPQRRTPTATPQPPPRRQEPAPTTAPLPPPAPAPVPGPGAPPGPAPAPSAGEGVVIYGRITDGHTGRGVRKGLFIVLQPGVLVRDVTSEADIYTMAETDNNGNYRLPKPLQRGQSYSVIVGAEGYHPIYEDGVYVPPDLPSPHEVNVVLYR
ncbi:MAG: trypsin-like peptidase domain-containing protein [Caldilineales bacterium]|nr:trypsin-like peptidase domain-containing protein [Caldilineales bacterium]